jgi:hypothetical protein
MIGDQDEPTCLLIQLHVGAPTRLIREVTLPDMAAFPLLLDQPSQGRGKQKDAGGAHQISAFHSGCRWSPQRLSGYGVTMDREREFVTVSARCRLIVNRAAQAMFMTAVRHQLGDSRR